MNELTLKSYAKINLDLKIGKKLANGYHELKSIMQQINLYDILKFKKLNENKINIKSNIKELENEKNIIYKTAFLIKNKFNINKGIEIILEKNIPLAAGLAGGSGNAAATLKALNKLWDLNLNENELINLARQIGSDVPFQIIGGKALVEATGEKVTKLNEPKEENIIIINPNIEISTKWAYDEFDKQNSLKKESENDFEPIIIEKYPIIKEIKQDLIKNGAEKALMSGSGPTVFGIFKDKLAADNAYRKLKNTYPFIKLTKTIK